MLSKIPWGEEIDMSTPTDATTRPSEEEPVDPAPVNLELPEPEFTDKDGNVHNHPVVIQCGPNCPQDTPA